MAKGYLLRGGVETMNRIAKKLMAGILAENGEFGFQHTLAMRAIADAEAEALFRQQGGF